MSDSYSIFTSTHLQLSLMQVFRITLLSLIFGSIPLSAQLLLVPRASEPVQIDGIISPEEWEDAISNSRISNLVNGEVDGVEDLSASVSFKWNEVNLYFLFQLTDDVRSLDSTDGDIKVLNTFDDDSIEIYLDLFNTKTGGLNKQAGRYQFRFIPQSDGEIERFPDTLSTEGFELATVGDQAYILEISMPWATLGLENPTVGHVLGFDVALNDDDDGGGRDGQLLWYATGPDDWQDPSKWGSILLTAPIDEINNPTIDDLPSMQTLEVGDQTWIAWSEIEEFTYQLRRSNDLNLWQNDGRELFSTGSQRYFIISPDDKNQDTFFQLLVTAPDPE